jgi:hypothetical protein
MTEKDLVDLGFEKCIGELDEPDWYYYTYDFASGLSLISCGSDELIDGEWVVEFFEATEFQSKSKIDILQVIRAIEKIKKKS